MRVVGVTNVTRLGFTRNHYERPRGALATAVSFLYLFNDDNARSDSLARRRLRQRRTYDMTHFPAVNRRHEVPLWPLSVLPGLYLHQFQSLSSVAFPIHQFVMDVLLQGWKDPDCIALPCFMSKLYSLKDMEEKLPEAVHMVSVVASEYIIHCGGEYPKRWCGQEGGLFHEEVLCSLWMEVQGHMAVTVFTVP
ncbi:hypothetical protein NDU88_000787 [Pleurodeles waltl]|uniref:Uncharacterized protein n=1 Tax=Pleurodeles waltl TaxID=8319 RepID=A0AAV7WIL0_PLEWA|nr:hypothetical protein NDU88_000787 [Pleurodeles waltl]